MSSEDKEEENVPEQETAADEETDPNLQEVEEDEAALDKLEKEGGDLAEFDLEAQIEEFRAALEEEPDNCVHHYNLAEALEELGLARPPHLPVVSCMPVIQGFSVRVSTG